MAHSREFIVSFSDVGGRDLSCGMQHNWWMVETILAAILGIPYGFVKKYSAVFGHSNSMVA
jgi:hypothetical protein